MFERLLYQDMLYGYGVMRDRATACYIDSEDNSLRVFLHTSSPLPDYPLL